MSNTNGVSIPMMSSYKMRKHNFHPFSDSHLYRYIVGALQCVTLHMSYIAFSVNQACQLKAYPLDSHWYMVKIILRYLSGTTAHGFLLCPSSLTHNFSLRTYSDLDWVSDPDDRESTSESCTFFASNLVTWSSIKQSLIYRSNIEDGYYALAHTTS